MTKFEVIKSWDLEHLAHFLSSTIQMCQSSDELMCACCGHHDDAICDKDTCINWLNSEVE